MKYSLITGSTGGLGSAFANELASTGNNLILVGRNQAKLVAQKNELEKEFKNTKIEVVLCNQCDEDSRNNAIQKLKNFEIEKAILNAGYIDEGPLLEKSDELVRDVIRTNCEGTILLSKALINQAESKNQKLELLVVSSLSAYYPMPQMAIYAASKAMLLHFFLAIREELKQKNIYISVLAPGGIPTTDAMKEAIRVQGLGGKLTSCSPQKVAHVGLMALAKHKNVAIPGSFNKLLKAAGILPKSFVAKAIGKRWSKTQNKLKEQK